MAKRKAQAGRKLVSVPIRNLQSNRAIAKGAVRAERQAVLHWRCGRARGAVSARRRRANRHGCLQPNRLIRYEERVRTAVMSNLIALREQVPGTRHRRNPVRRGKTMPCW